MKTRIVKYSRLDADLNMLPVNRPCYDDEEVDDVVLCSYTGLDFIYFCDGDAQTAIGSIHHQHYGKYAKTTSRYGGNKNEFEGTENS